MKFDRASGILLHITSLPGEYGVGDLGPAAYRWIDFLSDSGCKYWQILPTGPTGYGDSPYQSFSANAGNHYLISPHLLIEDGLLITNDLEDMPDFEEESVDYGQLIPWKFSILNIAFSKFTKNHILQNEYQLFIDEEKDWLGDYALFMAIKACFAQSSWTSWPEGLRDRQQTAIAEFISQQAKEIEKQQFFQFIFFRQWDALRKYAVLRDIKIIGDLPIYVAHDSVEVWTHRELFRLFHDGYPEVLSGVPPDYFSPEGQLWGNPIYRWGEHKKTSFRWWINRISKLLKMVDLIRMDHFIGFAGYWEIPAGSDSAENGKWVVGPGEALFESLQVHFGELPFIAEDLGEITPEVIKLRDQFGFAGMRILQFAFTGENDNPFLPDKYPKHCVAYTGTHDNEPIMGWYTGASNLERATADKYLARYEVGLPWSMIHFLWQSPADLVFIQMQDALALGTEARMNFPSTTEGNWRWRMKSDMLDEALRDKLFSLNKQYDR